MSKVHENAFGAVRLGLFAVALVAAMVAAMFATTKTADAQVTDNTTVEIGLNPVEVNFGTVFVDDRVAGSVVTRQITVTNDGTEDVTLRNVTLTGEAGEIIDFTTNIGPDGLVVESGGSNTFEVTFNPSAGGTRDAVLSFGEAVVGSVGGVPGSGVVADVINLVDENGNVVPGVNLGGTADPVLPPGATSDCTIIGTSGNNTLVGTAGRDIICALGGNDKVRALGGNDVVRGGTGNDVSSGNGGNDVIVDKKGKDKVFGGGGKDKLNVKDGKRGDLAKGGSGKDRVKADKKDKARR